MKLLGFAFVGGYASAALILAAPVATVAQARLAPSNPQQGRCIEAFAETAEEKAMREAIGEPPAEVRKEMKNAEGWEGLEALQRWGESRAIEVFGSEEAARTAGEKMRIEKYTRRLKLLREAAGAGHLPSLYRLVGTSGHKEYDGIPGAMGPEEKASALRTLYEYNFPFRSKTGLHDPGPLRGSGALWPAERPGPRFLHRSGTRGLVGSPGGAPGHLRG